MLSSSAGISSAALCGTGSLKSGAWISDCARERRDRAGRAGHVQRQLAERARFLVRFPSELLVRHALEHASRRLGFLFEFLSTSRQSLP